MPDAPRVLVVEDSVTTRQIVAISLRNAGFDPVVVTCVQEAQAALRESVPAIVVTDLRLPDATGFSLIRHIRGNPSLARVKVVLISGVPAAELATEPLPEAYDFFLEKPFSLRRLLEVVRMAVHGERVRLAYRPRAGDRLKMSSTLVAKLEHGERREHCVEVHDVVEVGADGTPRRVQVAYPERWVETARGRDPHPLQGRRAMLYADNGHVQVSGADGPWPRALVPPLASLLPGREVAVEETVDVQSDAWGAQGRLAVRRVEEGVAITAVDVTVPLDEHWFTANGEVTIDRERGVILSGKLEGIVDGEGRATLIVTTVMG